MDWLIIKSFVSKKDDWLLLVTDLYLKSARSPPLGWIDFPINKWISVGHIYDGQIMCEL